MAVWNHDHRGYTQHSASALGWKQPEPQPVDPAWMVEVVREVMRDERGMTAKEIVIRAIRLALSRGHVVLAPVMPSEEEMRAGAREDAAQIWEKIGYPAQANECRMTGDENCQFFRGALQARRNVYASLGAVRAAPASSAVSDDALREMLNRAWEDGFGSAATSLDKLAAGEGSARTLYDNEREDDVSAILETFKTGGVIMGEAFTLDAPAAAVLRDIVLIRFADGGRL